jgi:hypothetical protein
MSCTTKSIREFYSFLSLRSQHHRTDLHQWHSVPLVETSQGIRIEGSIHAYVPPALCRRAQETREAPKTGLL